MPDLQALLERIEWLDKAATPGPWVKDKSQLYDYVEPHPYDLYEAGEDDPPLASDILPRDAEFIALARTALPKLAEAVYQVLELLDAEENRPSNRFAVMYDGQQFPATVPVSEVRRAITDAMEGDE